MRRDREPAYGSDPAEETAPILIELGMDLRLHLRLDLRQFLRVHGLDPQSGEPSPDELQAVLIERLRQYLRSQSYMLEADVQWIDDAVV